MIHRNANTALYSRVNVLQAKAGKGVPATGGSGTAIKGAGDDDDDNIFDDVGTDYKPSVTGKKKPPPPGSETTAGGSARAEDDDMEVEDQEEGEWRPPAPPAPPPPPPQTQQLQDGGSYAVPRPPPAAGVYAQYDQHAGVYGVGDPAWGQNPYAATAAAAAQGYGDGSGQGGLQQQQQVAVAGQEEPRWRVRTRRVEERMVDFVDDAYGEYYPMAVSGRRLLALVFARKFSVAVTWCWSCG
jgi:hypothetical protein